MSEKDTPTITIGDMTVAVQNDLVILTNKEGVSVGLDPADVNRILHEAFIPVGTTDAAQAQMNASAGSGYAV